VHKVCYSQYALIAWCFNENWLIFTRSLNHKIHQWIYKKNNSNETNQFNFSASSICSTRNNLLQWSSNSISVRQVTGWTPLPSSQCLNISWQQATTQWDSCACFASIRSKCLPVSSKSRYTPNCFHCGARDSIMFTRSPFLVFSVASSTSLGFESEARKKFEGTCDSEHLAAS